LAEVEQRSNAGIHLSDHRRHGGSKKRKGNVNRGGMKAIGLSSGNEDWTMGIEDDAADRDRKRVKA